MHGSHINMQHLFLGSLITNSINRTNYYVVYVPLCNIKSVITKFWVKHEPVYREDQAVRFQLAFFVLESEPFYELKLELFTIIIIVARSNFKSGQI